MCVQAAINLSDNYNKDLSDVDFIIVATTTPDQIVPNVASQIQTRLKYLMPELLIYHVLVLDFAMG